MCETEDAALLMALEQGWFGFGRWQVIDAEGCCVGRVIGSHLLDEQGARFASIWHESAALQSIRGKNGKAINRAEIIRALIDGLIDSGMDVTGSGSEADLRARVARRLGTSFR